MDFWTAYWTFVSFVFGAIVGSFLNVCIYRLPHGESLWEPPSHCPKCSHQLRFFPDMVPMLSQAWNRSRCRYCGVKFAWRYFWVELITAVLFAAIYLRYVVFSPHPGISEADRNWIALAGMVFTGALVAIFFIDLDTFHIPDVLVWVALGAAVSKDLFLLWIKARPLSEPVLGTIPVPMSILGAAASFWLLWQFAAIASAIMGKEAMGGGDPLLLGAMGAFLIPWPLVVLAFIVAVFLGTVFGVAGNLLYREPEAAGAGSPSKETEEESPPAAYATGGEGEQPAVNAEAVDGVDGLDGVDGVDGSGRSDQSDESDQSDGSDRSDGSDQSDGSDRSEESEESEQPQFSPPSRWGRLWTVIGTWGVAATVWMTAEAWRQGSAGQAVGIGVTGVLMSAGILFYGVRLWVWGDHQKTLRDWLRSPSGHEHEDVDETSWSDQMDEFFEGDPGPRVIPFGPYLVTGTFVAMLFGYPLLTWYMTKFMGVPAMTVMRMPWD